MIPLREKKPVRRLITKAVNSWGDHKPDLKIDFNDRCAYCDSYDGLRHTWYEVDHFIPKAFFRQFGNITDTQYDNLVYSCKFCNNGKLNKWPSQSETVFNDGKVGFVDPCSEEYDSHFYRNADGSIMWTSELGKWMHQTAFKFDQRERGIKLLWNLQKLKELIIQIEPIVEQLTAAGQDSTESHSKLLEYTMAYFKFHNDLIAYYDSLNER
jgi:hypothetical protein